MTTTLLVFFLLLFSILVLEFFFLKIKVNGKAHKQYHFTFSRYVFYIIFLIVSTVFIIYREGISLLLTILAFTVIGPFFEWFIGITYYKIVGQKLWTYHRGTVHGYTSYLAIPLWAFGGVLAWIVVKYFI